MRTPIEIAVLKPVPVEDKPHTLARDGAAVSRPFSDILAEAEAVRDVVRLSGRTPGGPLGLETASAVGAWKDAWLGLCRGANGLMAGAGGLAVPRGSRKRPRAR